MRRNGRLPGLCRDHRRARGGVAVTVLQASTYRADASVALVRQGQPPGDDPAARPGRRGRRGSPSQPRRRRPRDRQPAASTSRRTSSSSGLASTPGEELARADHGRGAEPGRGAARRTGADRARDGALQRPLRAGDDRVSVGGCRRGRGSSLAEARSQPRARRARRRAGSACCWCYLGAGGIQPVVASPPVLPASPNASRSPNRRSSGNRSPHRAGARERGTIREASLWESGRSPTSSSSCPRRRDRIPRAARRAELVRRLLPRCRGVRRRSARRRRPHRGGRLQAADRARG